MSRVCDWKRHLICHHSRILSAFCSFLSRGLAQKRGGGERGGGPNGGGRVGRSFVVRKEQTTAGAYRTIFEWRQRRSLVLYWLSIHCNCKLLKFCRVSTNSCRSRNSRGLTATLDDKKLLDCIILLFLNGLLSREKRVQQKLDPSLELDRTLACRGGELKKTKQKKQQQKKDVHYLKKHHEVSSDTITAGQVPSAKKKYQATFQTQKN